jgi:hypothetical protein
MSRSTDAQKAERLNAAHRLLARGQSVGEAALSSSRQFAMSRRQAYRYIEEAQLIGRPVPTGPRQRVTKPFRLSGRAVYGDKSSSHERPRDQWIEIPIPAIVSDDTVALAAERLADNKRFAPRRTIEPSIVQGLVSCRKCGYALSFADVSPHLRAQNPLLSLPRLRRLTPSRRAGVRQPADPPRPARPDRVAGSYSPD